MFKLRSLVRPQIFSYSIIRANFSKKPPLIATTLISDPKEIEYLKAYQIDPENAKKLKKSAKPAVDKNKKLN